MFALDAHQVTLRVTAIEYAPPAAAPVPFLVEAALPILTAARADSRPIPEPRDGRARPGPREVPA